MTVDISAKYLRRKPEFSLNRMQLKLLTTLLNKYGWQSKIPIVERELYISQPKDLFEHSHPTNKGCLIRIHVSNVHI